MKYRSYIQYLLRTSGGVKGLAAFKELMVFQEIYYIRITSYYKAEND